MENEKGWQSESASPLTVVTGVVLSRATHDDHRFRLGQGPVMIAYLTRSRDPS